MGLIHKFIDTEKTSKVKMVSPKELYGNMLKAVSGHGAVRDVKFDIFYQIIAFKGVVEGVGCSTLVANTALAVAQLGLSVCVIDTSVLSPVQDILLKTDYKNRVPDKDKRLDWFDLPFTKLSVLHESKLHRNISVLSFYGKDRGVVDMLSTNDTADLVELAYTQLHTKFDLILVDCCHEVTSVNTAALQQSQHVIQVWNDAPTVVHNIENFINNCACLSCPLDKMRTVVYSKIMDDVVGDLDSVLAQYRLNKLASCRFSKDVQRVAVIGGTLYQYASEDEDIVNYTEFIIAIACHVCNIHDENEPHGTITSQEIMDGKVEGTYHKELKDYNEALDKATEGVKIARTLEEADSQLGVSSKEESTFDSEASEVAEQENSTKPEEESLSESDFAPDDEEEVHEEKVEEKPKKKKGLFGKKK